MKIWATLINTILGVWQSLLNPEEYRKRKLIELRKEEKKLQNERDKILSKNWKDEDTAAIALGNVISQLRRVRKEISHYSR